MGNGLAFVWHSRINQTDGLNSWRYKILKIFKGVGGSVQIQNVRRGTKNINKANEMRTTFQRTCSIPQAYI